MTNEPALLLAIGKNCTKNIKNALSFFWLDFAIEPAFKNIARLISEAYYLIVVNMSKKLKLSEAFFDRSVIEVAKDLLGKTLVFDDFKGIITETEAYPGRDDEASHAFKGPTPRSSIMFGKPGYSYVYLIYGIYYCLNIVTEKEGQGSAVLIRGLKLPSVHLNGPGKICRHLGITKAHSAIHLISSNNFYLIEGIQAITYEVTPRIGIKKSVDKFWRFVMTPT